MIESLIVSTLAANAAVAALVATRITPAPLPQGSAMPAITFHRVTTTRQHTYEGKSGFAVPIFQITCWADDGLTRDTLAVAVKNALDTQSLQDSPLTVQVQVCFLEDERSDFEPGPRPLYKRDMDFHFFMTTEP